MKKYRLRLTVEAMTRVFVTIPAQPPSAGGSPGVPLKSSCKESS